jgi:hypothetical protein
MASFVPSTGNTYYAQTGGVLNGNLSLGRAIRWSPIWRAAPGQLCGHQRHGQRQQFKAGLQRQRQCRATTTAASGFSSLGYQLANGASLALTGQGTQTSSLYLAGTGTVTLDGTMNVSNRLALQTMPLTSTAGYGGASSAIALVNNGTIAITHDNAQTYVNSAMLLLGADSLVNNGTITGRHHRQQYRQCCDNRRAGRRRPLAGSLVNTGIATTGINAVGLTSSYTWGIGTVNGALINSGQITSNGRRADQQRRASPTRARSPAPAAWRSPQARAWPPASPTRPAGSFPAWAPRSAWAAARSTMRARSTAMSIWATPPMAQQLGHLYRQWRHAERQPDLWQRLDCWWKPGRVWRDGHDHHGKGINWLGHQRSGTATVTLGGRCPPASP